MAREQSQSSFPKVLDFPRGDSSLAEGASGAGLILAALIYLRWADFQEAEREAIAAFDDSDYQPVLPASLHWRSWHALPADELQRFFADRLAPALKQLNNFRHNSLATHLHRFASIVEVFEKNSSLSDFLGGLISWLADKPFETPNDRRALLDVFDAVLEEWLFKLSGESHTPPSIARLMVELAAPTAGDRVYDPCFGLASLLTAACDHVLRQDQVGFARSVAPTLTIFGVENNSVAYLFGLTRLVLAGIDDPYLELGNSLERTSSNNPQRDGFDVVLANPPWGMRAESKGVDHFPVHTKDTTGLFVQHALSQLRPGGRAVIVVPQGFLFRGGPEQRLRRMIVEQHTVEAIVGLPETVFMPYTAVRGSILVLRRGGPTERIRMVDGEAFFEKGKGRQPATISTEQTKQLAQNLRAPQPPKDSWDVEAESLAEVDWDFTPRRRDQSGLIGELDQLRSGMNVLPLRKCCRIFTGRAIMSSHLVDKPVGEEPIPYVRIKDVQRGQATKGSSWLSPNSTASLDAKWKLRAGDVLLSKSGTIGKAGIVRNGAVGAIAASGLFVLRADQDRLDPHFLIAYLSSSECRAWLADKARGAYIQHLSKRVIEDLPIPLPPLQLQLNLAEEYRKRGIDALTSLTLTRLLDEFERDSIAEWIEKVIEFLPAHKDAINDPLDLTLLDRLATEVRTIRNEAAHGRHGESPLAAWILQFNEAVSGLRSVQNVPRGPGLLSLLQESAHGLKDAIKAIKGNLPKDAKARNLTQLIASWLDLAISALLNDVKLILSMDVGSLQAGEMIEISLQVHNQGPLPLRDLSITTTPDWGQSEFGYLAENSKVAINLSGMSPKLAGTFTLIANWSGSTLDGQRINGSREIALNVIEAEFKGIAGHVDFGGSPYVCGDPVRPERNDVFFGRDELLDQIRRQIIQSGNVVLLEGNRRSGKSSILWHLEGQYAVPGWMGIYCSFQGAEGSREGVGVPTVEVFRAIAYSIATSLHSLGGGTPLPDGTMLPPGKKLGVAKACRNGINEASAFSDFRDYTEVALEKLTERNLGLLLLLDEFDKLQEGIDNGITSPQVPENFRFLVQTYPRFSAILTGSRRLRRLREEYWSALYGLGTRFGVTSLPAEVARRLVIEPVKGRLTYSREAVDRAISLTAGQPYLLQCFCNRVFDIAAQLKTQSVTLDLVEKTGDALVEDNEHFASLWDYAGSDRRRFILYLCHREAERPDPFRLGVIQERLVSHGVEVDDETLIADIEFLRELELIDLVGESSGGHYVLAIPLMGTWIEKQQDFAAVMSKARSETEDQHG